MKNRATKVCVIILIVYLAVGALFYPIAGESLHSTADSTDPISGTINYPPELLAGQYVEQRFVCDFDTVTSIKVMFGTYGRENTDVIKAELFRGDETEPIWSQALKTADMDDGIYTVIEGQPIEDAKGKHFKLRLTSLSGTAGDAVTLHCGNTVNGGRVQTQAEFDASQALHYFKDAETGVLVTDKSNNPCNLQMSIAGLNLHWFGAYYWFFYAGVALLLTLYFAIALRRHSKGKKTLIPDMIDSLFKYGFLIRQLVARDFKTKYKRSVLGVLWSFLNPLITMSVQWVVFSYFFKSDIEKFPIYLLCGIVCFNFFNEATNMCLMSIVGNAPLINKVYVPKYIYPFSRTMSSGINLLLSLVPLFIMLLCTKTWPTQAVLLLPFVLIMLFMLSYGVGLILATMMVFFRDTQFLWNIFSMLLMYLTPVFYPETIIPARFMTVYKLNPLYHILRFMRSILIDGVSLEPKAYLYCFILCAVPFLVGLLIFRKNQDKFVLNI